MSHSPDGSVSFAVVVKVMQVMAQAGGFTFRVDEMTVTVVKDSSPEVITLLDPVGRRMVARLANKYCGGKIEYFYHPDMVVVGNGTAH